MPPPTGMTSFDANELGAFAQQWRRRAFLQGSLLLASAASTGLLAGCQPTVEASSTPVLWLVLRRLQPIILPDVAPLVSAKQISIEKNTQALLTLMDDHILKDIELAASLFEYGASVLGWHFAKFSSLDDADATAYVERWQNGASLQRGIVTVFKKLLYASYWRDPATWQPVGFEGPVSERWGLPSLGNAPFPVDLSSTDLINAAKEAV